MNKYECKKMFCDMNIESNSGANKALLNKKKELREAGITDFENDEGYKVLAQCKSNVEELLENPCPRKKSSPPPKKSQSPPGDETETVEKLKQEVANLKRSLKIISSDYEKKINKLEDFYEEKCENILQKRESIYKEKINKLEEQLEDILQKTESIYKEKINKLEEQLEHCKKSIHIGDKTTNESSPTRDKTTNESSPTRNKKQRCKKGTRRNPKTGKCEEK
jgi:predicted RNase H-like nuclease (RuvC/YqgF family)